MISRWDWQARPGTHAAASRPSGKSPDAMPIDPLVQLRHLLKVAGSVAGDANVAWADLWGDFKPYVTPGGMIVPAMAKGFVPSCGWPEFLEKFWTLKHYIDSIQRVCGQGV